MNTNTRIFVLGSISASFISLLHNQEHSQNCKWVASYLSHTVNCYVCSINIYYFINPIVLFHTVNGYVCSIKNGELKLEDIVLTKSILENTKCFLLDCGTELFVWVGRVTQVEDRKTASAAVEVKPRTQIAWFVALNFFSLYKNYLLQKFIIKENRPKTTRITQVIQGYENHTFKSKFESWPVSNTAGNASTEEGRIKVTGNIFIYWYVKIDLLSLLIAYVLCSTTEAERCRCQRNLKKQCASK